MSRRIRRTLRRKQEKPAAPRRPLSSTAFFNLIHDGRWHFVQENRGADGCVTRYIDGRKVVVQGPRL